MNPEDLGIDPEDFVWQDLALCKDMPPEFFAERYEESAHHARAIDQMCELCPVRQQCADYARSLDPKVFGVVYAGIYWTWGKPDKNKNAGKDLSWLK